MRISFNPTGFQPDAIAVLAGKDGALPGAAASLTGEMVKRALQVARFEGEVGTIVELLAPQGVSADRLLVVGAGAADARDAHAFEKIGGALAARLHVSGARRLAVELGEAEASVPPAEAAARLAHGAQLRAYRFDQYRTKLSDKKKPTLEEVAIMGAPPEAEALHARLEAVAAGVFRTRDLVTEPANILYPESFVERTRSISELGVEIEVLDEHEMGRLGMGALLGVAQGSERPARLLVLRWNGAGGDAKPVVFVGKGVTFDTGGISIKPSQGMDEMKWDMGGAGAVVGALHALAARKARANVVGVCGLVENMPSGKAQRPGDVVTTMSGQTVEVLNTDAEGRLVLADAMWFAQERFAPEVMIDLATLTGAMVISLGHEHAGVFSNSDELANALLAAGLATGDKLWRMPMGEAYDKLLESKIADMQNIGPREAGSISAAQFLARFVRNGVRWAHLDIAGTVWAKKDGTLWEKGATGYGVRLLDRYIADSHEAR